MPNEADGRTVEAALAAARLFAKPGQLITVTHWWSRNGSEGCITVEETA